MNRRSVRLALRLAATLAFTSSCALTPLVSAQDSPRGRGRKYKPPPETSHIEVLVTKGYNHKPVSNAAVIFHELKADGSDEGNLEVKTDPDGKAIIDVIPIGSKLRVQVLASGFATFAEDYDIAETSREIPVALRRPQEQISAYEDNSGKPSDMKPGVQEPIRPKPANTSKSVKVPPSTEKSKAPPLPPSEQNTPSPVPNPPPSTSPNR